ncbi:MAG: ROK family protein [Eubacteriales bacterium]|nr:ROK family protein [Eubacteriales bacterium]
MNNIEVKKVNRNNLLRYMLRSEQISKRNAAAALGLSIPTVTQGLHDLLSMGLVREDGSLESRGGRKSVGYKCIKDAKVAVGVDITRSHVNVVAIDLAMNLLFFNRTRMEVRNDEESYQNLRTFIQSSITDNGLDASSIIGLGVSLPAIISGNGKDILAMHEEMKISYDLYNIMSEWFPYPINIQNDADSAGTAEILMRELKEENTVYYYFGPSVGGSIMLNGKPVPGINRRAGEFGHMTLHPGGRECYCGRKGCVNAYCSTNILSECTGDNLEDFFQHLESGDKTCKDVWEKYMDSLALAIHNMISAFDLNIIIGGYLGKHMPPYMPTLEKKIMQMDPYLDDIHFITPAILKYEAAAIGAAAGFIENYLSAV